MNFDIMLDVNNEHGCFTSKASSICVYPRDTEFRGESILQADFMPTTVGILNELKMLRLGRRRVRLFGHAIWVGNIFWDSFLLNEMGLADVLSYIKCCRDGQIMSGYEEVFDEWKADKASPITVEDIRRWTEQPANTPSAGQRE